MRFAYYEALSAESKRIYRKSDALLRIAHLDNELYKLPETFHTQGFYARESALMRELLGEAPGK